MAPSEGANLSAMARRSPGTQVPPGRVEEVHGRQEPIPGSPLGTADTPRLLHPDWLPRALMVGDAVICAVSVLAAYWVRYGNASQTLPFGPYLAAIPVVVVLYIFALAVNHQYWSWRGRTLVDQLLALYSGVGLAAVLILAAIEVTNLGQHYSRLTFIQAVLLSAVLMTGERYLLRQYETRLRRQGIGTERVLMVGTGAGSELLIRRMNMFPQYGFTVVGIATDEGSSDPSFVGVPVVGRVTDLPSLVRELKVDQVFLALPSSQRDRLLHLIKVCEDEQLEFKIVPDLLELMSTTVAANEIDGLPLVGIRRNRLQGSSAIVKRAVDILVSATIVVLLAPLMLGIAILIKVTMPGALLFRQERIGLRRTPFLIYKFRTMIVDAEAKTGPVVAMPGDSRVTRLGRILRQLSLDELPQLYNVLRGDMSLVGPRPQPTFFDERYGGEVPRYLERQQVRPGLTGWAEVNDLRGAAPIGDRTMYDVYYIENWSLALDLKIVLLTALRIFSQRHAY
jgi:exopolysaccharide biosynthesis polyprenyl glycosylphosphotransferase